MRCIRTLKAVAVLGLLADDVEHGVDELGALGVVPLGPVVPGAGLAEDEVVRAEDLAVRAGAHGVHGPRLEVHEHGARDEAAAAGLVVVDVDALELEVGVARVLAAVVDAVLVADDLPELGPDLVAALAGLDVEDLPHGGGLGFRRGRRVWGRLEREREQRRVETDWRREPLLDEAVHCAVGHFKLRSHLLSWLLGKVESWINPSPEMSF
jgi:hypothetical protein